MPLKIPMKIVERVMNNWYFGDGTVHPGDHLLLIHELCGLFKCAGISMDQVKGSYSLYHLREELWNGINCRRMADLLDGRKL